MPLLLSCPAAEFGDRDFIGDNYWSEGSFARRARILAPQPCMRWISKIQTMMQLFASAAKLRGGGPILQGGF
jgi:hypothetical protein